MSATESTYKDRDTEELLDMYFYRPVGFRLAQAAGALRLTPNEVTFLSMIVGVVAGHLFYYSSMRLTVFGIFLLILSDALDSADGQLARLSGIKSKMGRIFDGLAGNIVFASIYIHICLRFMAEGGSGWIFALAGVAGVCHSFQSALADYYRNGYLHFVRGPKSGELDSSAGILDQYQRLSWSKDFREKVMLRFYLEHIREQEMVSRRFLELKTVVAARYGDAIPKHISDNYRTASRPMIKYYNILTINTRIIALILFLLIGMPLLYFVFELVVLNLLFVYVIIRQERISLNMLASLEGGSEG